MGSPIFVAGRKPQESLYFLLLIFPQRRPAETGGDSGLVEFALDYVLRASVVKTEDLVVDVETIHDKAESMSKAEASLGVELEVRIKIVVAEWTGRAV